MDEYGILTFMSVHRTCNSSSEFKTCKMHFLAGVVYSKNILPENYFCWVTGSVVGAKSSFILLSAYSQWAG